MEGGRERRERRVSLVVSSVAWCRISAVFVVGVFLSRARAPVCLVSSKQLELVGRRVSLGHRMYVLDAERFFRSQRKL